MRKCCSTKRVTTSPLLLFGLFASVSLQKSVRDRDDDIPVTGLHYAICWFSLIIALVLLTIGLFNASLLLSEKGFYAMAYALSLFGAVAVQKNTRDAMDVSAASRAPHAVPPALE